MNILTIEDKINRIKRLIKLIEDGESLTAAFNIAKIDVHSSKVWQEKGYLIKEKIEGTANSWKIYFPDVSDEIMKKMAETIASSYMSRKIKTFSEGPYLPEGEKQELIKELAPLFEWIERYGLHFNKSHLAPIVLENVRLKKQLHERVDNSVLVNQLKEEIKNLKSDNIALRKSLAELLKGKSFEKI
jgi:hypothetical protein